MKSTPNELRQSPRRKRKPPPAIPLPTHPPAAPAGALQESLFKIVDRQPFPVLASDPDGTPRKADGVNYFNLSQAAQATGWGQDRLEKLWVRLWALAFNGLDILRPQPLVGPIAAHAFELARRVGRLIDDMPIIPDLAETSGLSSNTTDTDVMKLYEEARDSLFIAARTLGELAVLWDRHEERKARG